MKTFADRIIHFNNLLQFSSELPKGIRIMNPFREGDAALKISTQFYQKYYSDLEPRHIIWGINPGRFGAGCTGVPFTDTKRLENDCGIALPSLHTHEPSSAFIYELIQAMGGPDDFYRRFYIQSICPLGFTRLNDKGRYINYNYYDDAQLQKAVMPFILKNIDMQLQMGVCTDIAFCLGTGKNYDFLKKLNDMHQFFERIISLEHPRFIMQYKSKQKQAYIQKYIRSLEQASNPETAEQQSLPSQVTSEATPERL